MISYPYEVKLEETPCPLGCSEGDREVFGGHDRLHDLPGEFTVVKCRTCGLMRTNPRPTPETIGFYYPEDYGPYQSTRVEVVKISGEPRPIWKRLVKRIVQFNTDCLPLLPKGRMLEVGCASGSFLHRMSGEGWEVEGVEFSAKAASLARSLGYKVHAGSLETAPEPDHPYDLVTGWMVLEHLHDPILVLRKLYRWTKPGGWLVVSVPNAESLEAHIFKDCWYALQLPTHLYHYTPRTLEMILAKGGWRIKRIFHQRVLGNLVASLGYVLQDKQCMPCLARMLIDLPGCSGRSNFYLYPLAYLMSVLGQTGRMTIWARRI
ncbi:MAG: class I SAM-dependent methyltransferase [Thermincolia bacterium]